MPGQILAVDTDRRLTAQGAERKQQLLDCAARLFAERGYEETRVIDIVRGAGVAKGLFYWYFDNKEALFEELAGNIRLRLRRQQKAVLDPAEPPLVNLRRGTEASVHFMAEHAPFFSLLEVEGRNFTEVVRLGAEEHLGDTVALVRAGQADGTIREDDAHLLAVGVVSSVSHYSHLHRTNRLTLPLAELASFVGRQVVHTLAADDAAALVALRAPDLLVPAH
jgi:AcrR family transcriptional regulator